MRSSFESLVCLEKYGLSGWVTRTSRPSIESSSAASSFLTKTGYTYLGGHRRSVFASESLGRSSGTTILALGFADPFSPAMDNLMFAGEKIAELQHKGFCV